MTDGIKRRRWGLKGRLVLLTLVVGTVPLLLGIGMAYFQGTHELQVVIGSSFAGLATETARKLDLVFGDEITRLSRIAADPVLIEALERDLKNVQGESKDIQRLRDEVETLKNVLKSPVRRHHWVRDALHDIRERFDDVLDVAVAEGIQVSRYIAEIGRILGM